MISIKSSGAIVAMLLMLLVTSAQAQEAAADGQSESTSARSKSRVRVEPTMAELEEQSRVAHEEEKWVRYYGANIKMMNKRPYEALYMKRAATASSLVGRLNTAYNYMMRLQKQGFSYDMNEDPDTTNMRGTELYDYLNDLMIKAGAPAGMVEKVAALPSDYFDPSALAWDESRGRLLAGTRSTGRVVAISDDGSTEVLIQADDEKLMWAVTGLHADSKNNRLWVSSAATPEFAALRHADQGQGALFEFNLKTLGLINRFNMPLDGKPHKLGPMTVTDAGDVYIVDLVGAVVYRKAAADNKLEQFLGSTELRALTDVAVKPDNSLLYLSDLYNGVLVISPEKETSEMLVGGEDMNFGRINSMSYSDGKLVIMQGGFKPQRVMQLDLDARGKTVTAMLPIASAQAEFDHPGLGVINGGYVYYVSNLGDTIESVTNQPRLLMRSKFPVEAIAPPAIN